MQQVDVLIIGSGPTGLMTALECARYGLSCSIIDKSSRELSDVSRAVVIQPRTLEVFSQIGIIDRFLRKGIQIHGANPTYHQKPLAHFNFSSLRSPYPFILSLEQQKTEKILEEQALSLGITIEQGWECIKIQEMPSSIVITLKNTESKEEKFCKASYLIGCDGAHSFVRKYLDLPFIGKTFHSNFSLADVCVHWDYPHDELTAFFGKEGILAAIPLPEKNRYRLIFELPKTSGKEPTLTEIEELIEAHIKEKVKLSDPRWISNFQINSRLSKSYQKGRIFLAGDAAHIHSPVGGQGMNTGIQDAFNLVWKIAYVLHKNSPPSLLDTYTLERHKVGARLLRGTSRASYLATLANPLAIWIRNKLISCLNNIPFLQKKLLLAISQTAICYPQSPLTVGARSGRRAPNVSLFYQGEKTDLYTLWRKTTTFHVLVFCDKNSIHNLPTLSLPCPIFYISTNPIKENELQICHDPCGSAHKAYKISTPTLFAIRPDGYIGWHGTFSRLRELILYLKTWS